MTGEKAIDASEQFHFSVTYSDDELKTYSQLIARRYARGQSNYTSLGLLFAFPFVIGFIVLGAVDFGLVEAAVVRPVLFTAYVAFAAGWLSYWFFVLRNFRKALSLNTLRGSWDYWFDAAGLGYKGATWEARFSWRAVDAIDDLDALVLFRCANHAVLVPTRMFVDNAARKAFVATCTARVKAAAEGAQP